MNEKIEPEHKLGAGILARKHQKLRFTELGETFFARILLSKCPDPNATTATTVEFSPCDFFRRYTPAELIPALWRYYVVHCRRRGKGQPQRIFSRYVVDRMWIRIASKGLEWYLRTRMVSFVRYAIVLIATLAFITSNVVLNGVHAAKPAHSHGQMSRSVSNATQHQHDLNLQALDGDSDVNGTSSQEHHPENSASGCCSFACGGAVIASPVPDLLPLALLSRLPLMLADSIRVADRPPHDRPPRTTESLAG